MDPHPSGELQRLGNFVAGQPADAYALCWLMPKPQCGSVTLTFNELVVNPLLRWSGPDRHKHEWDVRMRKREVQR